MNNTHATKIHCSPVHRDASDIVLTLCDGSKFSSPESPDTLARTLLSHRILLLPIPHPDPAQQLLLPAHQIRSVLPFHTTPMPRSLAQVPTCLFLYSLAYQARPALLECRPHHRLGWSQQYLDTY